MGSLCIALFCSARGLIEWNNKPLCKVLNVSVYAYDNFVWGFVLDGQHQISDVTSARLSGGYRPVSSICFPGISDVVHFYHITLTEIEFPLMHFYVS